MKALIGRKIGMTQLLTANGVAVPVTLVQAGPCTVLQVRDSEVDGYTALQLGFETANSLNKAQAGHAKASKVLPKVVREFRVDQVEEATKVGSSFNVTEFEEGDKVEVSGTSKGKGFAGTIKRHNFKTSAKSHGGNGVVRKVGSIGSMYPQKVYKGRKMPGQMGAEKVTMKNQTIAMVDQENNVLAIRGAVPGPRGAIVTVVGGRK